MAFVKDLKEGEAYEKRIIENFQTTFGIRFEKNTNPKGVDLVHPLFTAEVKYDRRVEETGNTFIETWNNSKLVGSGLFAAFDIEPMFFVIGCEKEALVFYTTSLRELVLDWKSDGAYRTINAGDGWRSKGMVVDWEELKEKALYVFTH